MRHRDGAGVKPLIQPGKPEGRDSYSEEMTQSPIAFQRSFHRALPSSQFSSRIGERKASLKVALASVLGNRRAIMTQGFGVKPN